MRNGSVNWWTTSNMLGASLQVSRNRCSHKLYIYTNSTHLFAPWYTGPSGWEGDARIINMSWRSWRSWLFDSVWERHSDCLGSQMTHVLSFWVGLAHWSCPGDSIGGSTEMMESYLPCLWIPLLFPVCKYQVMHSLCTGELKDQEVLGSVPHDQQTTWPLLQTHSPWERCARISRCRSALQLRLEQMASLFTSCHVLCSSRERNTGSRKSSPTEKEKWGQDKLKAGENGRVEGNQLAHVHNSREPSWSACVDLVVVF